MYYLRLLTFLITFFFLEIARSQTHVFAELNGTPALNTSGWNLNGNAYVGDTPGDSDGDSDELILTSALEWQNGGVFYATPINPSLCSKWTVEFEYRIFDGTGADGLAFCFLDVPPTGFVSGGGMGIPSTANGLKVGFDTWNNCGEPNPELQIFNGSGYDECIPGIVKVDNTTGSLNFVRNSSYQPVRIEYDNGNISLFVNNTLYLSTFSTIGFSGYMGFTASTGGFTDQHSIKNVIIYTEMADADAGQDQEFCQSITTQIGTSSNSEYSYSWSPSTGLDDPTISNPTVTLSNAGSSTNVHQYVVTTTLNSNPSCPNTDTITLSLHPTFNEAITHTQCGGTYLFDGNELIASGEYSGVFLSSEGCDSLVTLDLTINTLGQGIDVISACESFTWLDGNMYTQSNNTAQYIIENGSANGCDSIVFLDLTINSIGHSIDSHIACESFTWMDGNTYEQSNNTAQYIIPNGASNGCDSIITLDLIITNNSIVVDNQVACDSFTWINNVTYYSSTNEPTIVFQGGASNGCDSIVQLNLILNNNTVGIETITACESYEWIDGNVYSTSTTSPTFTLEGGNYLGCDSTVQLHLTIDDAPLLSVSNDTTICSGESVILSATGALNYTWNNSSSEQSTIELAPNQTTSYVVTGNNSNGCSSSETINVTVLPTPYAHFISTPSTLNIDEESTVNFTNTSTGGGNYWWDFNDENDLQSGFHMSYTYHTNAIGEYPITLYAENDFGCSDSFTYILTIHRGIIIYIPNSFTPDGDEFNHVFNPIIEGDFDRYNYQLEIYNRWGEILFSSNNPYEGWDGTYLGQKVANDTYIYQLTYKVKSNDEKEILSGHVNLIR